MSDSPVVPRPTFHFTPLRNWMNDPNGLVHDRGRWHLFYQFNPEGSEWGNMSWGHATSTDLQHWTEHPVALRFRDGEQIFSGSIVSTPAADGTELTAYYTSAYADGRQAQSRATSKDGGFTWELDADNPVLDRGTSAFRDPKVIRYTDGTGRLRWILLAVEAEERQVHFYTSDDLRSWEHASAFGPLGPTGVVWECPDLVPLPLDDDPDDVRWALILSTNPVGDDADRGGSSMSYVVGRFDGTRFTADSAELVGLDSGRDFYAGVTFDSAPHGAAIMVGWMSNWRYAEAFPSTPWKGAMSLPRQLALHTVRGRPRLVQRPPSFLLEQLTRAARATAVAAEQPVDLSLSGHSVLDLRWDPDTTGAVSVRLRGDADACVDLEHSGRALRVTRRGPAAEAVHADFPSTSVAEVGTGGPVQLLLSLDGPLLEIFADHGAATVSNLVPLGLGPIAVTVGTERPGAVTYTAVDVASDESMPDPATTPLHAPQDHPATAL
ncbi:glycoside hydrolase family 32 protein [Nocardioides sp. NPDC058538]|uniref:glycoside hydrolase family 32 protein n=1 Tax=Nocardioides sp. NPDC058538 TaxID=3346542 RepID=UPI003656A02D